MYRVLVVFVVLLCSCSRQPTIDLNSLKEEEAYLKKQCNLLTKAIERRASAVSYYESQLQALKDMNDAAGRVAQQEVFIRAGATDQSLLNLYKTQQQDAGARYREAERQSKIIQSQILNEVNDGLSPAYLQRE